MGSVLDMLNLNNRTALITGAGGGLGRVIVKTLIELGANLVLVDNPQTDFDSIKEKLGLKDASSVQCFHCDLESKEDRALLIKKVNKNVPKINILINNAAFVGTSQLTDWSTNFENQSIETWERALTVNLTAIFDLCKGLYPAMSHGENNSIINIASIYGLYGPDMRLYEGTQMGNPAAYATSKGGVIQLTRWLATTLSPNVRVNSVSPGGILRNQPKEFVERYIKKTPLQRMATENDMRGAIVYLASDMSEYVTGQNIIVDGGWGVW